MSREALECGICGSPAELLLLNLEQEAALLRLPRPSARYGAEPRCGACVRAFRTARNMAGGRERIDLADQGGGQ